MSRRRVLTVVVAVLAAAVPVLAGCGATEGTGDKGYVSGGGIITQLAVDERKKPGEVSGETLEGEQVSLADYRGKIVVLNVWGSWCPPCRAEADDLVEAAEQLAAEDVVFLGINTRDEKDNALAFERKYDVPYPSLFDPDGQTLLAFRGTLSPAAIPSTVVIDREGRVAASILDEITSPRTLVGVIEDVDR